MGEAGANGVKWTLAALLPACDSDFRGKSDGRSLLNHEFHITNRSSKSHQIMTLAGVAQSVERVALITAKRSTSRSWVRAPPSAIPISKLIRAAVLLFFGRLLSV